MPGLLLADAHHRASGHGAVDIGLELVWKVFEFDASVADDVEVSGLEVAADARPDRKPKIARRIDRIDSEQTHSSQNKW